MRKTALPVALLLAGVGLSGCPVYDDDQLACFDDYDCPSTHFCDYPSGECIRDDGGSKVVCDSPNDCTANQTCSKNATCVDGDCSFSSVGCVRGFECRPESGRWECVPQGSGSGGEPSSGGGGGGGGGGPLSSDGGAPMSSNGGVPSTATGGQPASSGGVGG